MNARKSGVTSVGRFGWFFMALGLGVVMSCGGDDTNNVPTGAGGSTGTGSGGAGGGGAMLNGCDSATAVDKTASATTNVAFSDIMYEPACIRIKAGSSVTWSGDFVQHPLVGGTINGTVKTPDPASPIKLSMSPDAGSVTFAFPSAGDFPYYCTIHGTVGMKGAVFVVP